MSDSEEEQHVPKPLTVEDIERLGLRDEEVVRLPEGYNEIGEDVFKDALSLREIYIPDGIYTIHGGAFAGCENLRKVRLPCHMHMMMPGAFACEADRLWERDRKAENKDSVYNIVLASEKKKKPKKKKEPPPEEEGEKKPFWPTPLVDEATLYEAGRAAVWYV